MGKGLNLAKPSRRSRQKYMPREATGVTGEEVPSPTPGVQSDPIHAGRELAACRRGRSVPVSPLTWSS